MGYTVVNGWHGGNLLSSKNCTIYMMIESCHDLCSRTGNHFLGAQNVWLYFLFCDKHTLCVNYYIASYA